MTLTRRSVAMGLGAGALASAGAASAVTRAPMQEGCRVLGRFGAIGQDLPLGLQFAWPASGVEARFFGSRVTALIDDNGRNLWDVTIDGQTSTLQLGSGGLQYDLFRSSVAGEHVIRLTRKSEIYDFGLTGIHSFDTDGEWLPMAPYAHRMLVLGDSISVGQNAAGDGPDCPYSSTVSAPLQSYGSLTAQAFNAELHLIAISGRGVIRNWDDGPEPLMPWQIDKALPDLPERWDQSRFEPELIVVNLGTNDFSKGYPGQRFDDGYASMLVQLRRTYPSARIICAFGPMEAPGAAEAIQRVTAVFDAIEGKTTPFLQFSLAESGHVWGCSSHPGIDSHRAMAEQLIALIQQEMGWARVA